MTWLLLLLRFYAKLSWIHNLIIIIGKLLFFSSIVLLCIVIRLIRVKMGRKPHVQYYSRPRRLTLLVIRIIWVSAHWQMLHRWKLSSCSIQKATLLLFYHKNVTTLLAKAIDCGLHFYLDGLVRGASKIQKLLSYSNNFDGQCCFFFSLGSSTIISWA